MIAINLEWYFISQWKTNRIMLAITSIALMYNVARGKLTLTSYVLLCLQITVQVAKIQLFKNKKLSLTQEITQAEPFFMVSLFQYNLIVGSGHTIFCYLEDDSSVLL